MFKRLNYELKIQPVQMKWMKWDCIEYIQLYFIYNKSDLSMVENALWIWSRKEISAFNHSTHGGFNSRKGTSPKLKTENMPASKLIQDFFCQCPLSKHTSMEVGGIHQLGVGIRAEKPTQNAAYNWMPTASVLWDRCHWCLAGVDF